MENFRPLKMLHGYAYPQGSTYEDKKKIVESRIDDLHDKGYGGIVTNVDFSYNYMENPENWELFKHSVNYAANTYGMKIWLYDENGYPSGTAGGMTLKENPDFECKALAMIKKPAKAGETVVIEKPRGHMNVISAYAVKNDGAMIGLSSCVSESRTLTYTADADCEIYYFITKKLYEGTHAQHNVCASRRYVSLTDKKAVAAFIRNTYKAYTDSLEGLDIPKDAVQAFFTDEPSFQACYINEGLNPQRVDDPYDNEIPLYPIVAWENDLDKLYAEKYGEALQHKLHLLFESDERHAKSFRFRFYTLLSKLYEEAFFCQISKFCEEHGIAFSGHLLLEENLLHHALFEGNFFDFMRHMHIPGIDMLYTKPKSVMDYAATPKLLSSVASWYAREHVMSEISGHTETALRIPFDINDIVCAQLLQLALGVDIFNSYFDDGALTKEENLILCDTVSRANAEFAGKISMANVLLYYPIESAQVSVKGSANQLYARPYDTVSIACEQSWRGHIDALIRNRYMFDCVSANALESAEVRESCKCIRNPISGLCYKALVIPKLSAVTSAAVSRFIKYAETGVPVIVSDMSDCIVVDAEDNSIIDALLSCKNVIQAASVKDSLAALRGAVSPAAVISEDMKDIVMLAKRDASSGKMAYMALNISESPLSFDITLTDASGSLTAMDPKNGEWRDTPAEKCTEGLKIHTDLPALGAVIIREV